MKLLNSTKKLLKSRKNKAIAVSLLLVVVLVGSVGGYALTRPAQEQPVVDESVVVEEAETEEKVPQTVEPEPIVEKTPEPVVSQWPIVYSLSEASKLTVVVNKKHKLPSDYTPSLQSVGGGNMRPEAANALSSMLNAAQNAGVPMRIISSYRSYSTQVSTYNKWVNLQGQAQADRSSARPGHSEHQTGLAVDLGMPDSSCDLLICFGDTAQGEWLAANAHLYGFIVRYESNTESVTGYQYEPWHMRYLDVDTATAVKNSGQTLDQYYGVEAGGY